jgi:hypothetical protein
MSCSTAPWADPPRSPYSPEYLRGLSADELRADDGAPAVACPIERKRREIEARAIERIEEGRDDGASCQPGENEDEGKRWFAARRSQQWGATPVSPLLEKRAAERTLLGDVSAETQSELDHAVQALPSEERHAALYQLEADDRAWRRQRESERALRWRLRNQEVRWRPAARAHRPCSRLRRLGRTHRERRPRVVRVARRRSTSASRDGPDDLDPSPAPAVAARVIAAAGIHHPFLELRYLLGALPSPTEALDLFCLLPRSMRTSAWEALEQSASETSPERGAA